MTALKYDFNNFGGAVIDPAGLPDNPDIFSLQLEKNNSAS